MLEFRKLWVNGSTPRVRFMGGTAAQRALVQTQAQGWTEHANLRFEFNNAPDAEIRIAFDQSDGAWSNVGTDCLSVPRNQPTMNLWFPGWWHCSARIRPYYWPGTRAPESGGRVAWNEEVVIRDLGGPPNSGRRSKSALTCWKIRRGSDQRHGIDPDSIMLYAFPARWTKNGVSTHENNVLSAMDKAFIASTRHTAHGGEHQ